MRNGMTGLTLRIAGAIMAILITSPAFAETANEPWTREDRALVIDAYEYNPIDWEELASDERIAGFINKASDGLPPAYRCKGEGMEYDHCRLAWKRYSVTKELYQTRRLMAKQLGLVWGAYHLGRPGNPEEQADHFLQFAEPSADDLIAIDIEDNDPEKFMSLADAEIFAQRIKSRTGRWPVLYTNGNTSRFIADHAHEYPILSRLQIWYARYRNEIEGVFPLGNWQDYALWQFASHINCKGKSTCPYRPPGTAEDIDVNVATMDKAALRKAWPFGELVPQRVPDVLVAGNDDTDDTNAKIAAPAEQVEFASVDADILDVPVPMPSPRDANAVDLAKAVAPVTDKVASEPMMAFTQSAGADRSAAHALAKFAAGKSAAAPARKVAATPDKMPAAKNSLTSRPIPSHESASLRRKTAERLSALIGTGEYSPATAFNHPLKAAIHDRAASLSTGSVKPSTAHSTRREARALEQSEEPSGIMDRIRSIIEDAPDEPLLALFGWQSSESRLH